MADPKSPSREPRDLRPEYDLTRLEGGQRGKYVARARAEAKRRLLERLRAAGPGEGLASVAGGGGGSEELSDLVATRKRPRSRRTDSRAP